MTDELRLESNDHLIAIQSNEWSRWQSNKNCAPLSRKGHTAVVYDGRMFVYGGYQDMRGSLGEMWQFTFGIEVSPSNESIVDYFF